jgi:hypothetical protein
LNDFDYGKYDADSDVIINHFIKLLIKDW